VRFVVKLGGHSLDDLTVASSVLNSLSEDLDALSSEGHQVCLVHGGGPQIDALLGALNIESSFIDGLRVTSKEAVSGIQMALSAVNASLVTVLGAKGLSTVGLSGFDGNLATSSPLDGPWGQVATDLKIDPVLLLGLMESGFVPVLSPVVSNGKGNLLNCNADELAGAVASVLKADALFLLSDIDQIRSDVNDSTTGLDRVSLEELKLMTIDGRASGGMLPKAKAAIAASSQGASRVIVANAALPNVITRILRNQAKATEVVA